MMHFVSVDSGSPFSTLAFSGSSTGPQQPEDAKSRALQVGGSGMADKGPVEDGYWRDDTLATRPEEEEDTEKEDTEKEDTEKEDTEKEEYFLCNETPAGQLHCQPRPRPAKPFQKWMKTLHKRVLRQQEMLGYDGSLAPWLREASDRGSTHHRHSSSDSSFAFVTAAKSASISMTGLSLLTRSRKTTIRSSRAPRTERSSTASVSGQRLSEESYFPEAQAPVDSAVIERALQRRRILEELISTEEAYVGDVRFLMNVYVTILASLPTTPPGLRSSVNQNLTDIVELHEELLRELRWVLPNSEYTQPGLPIQQQTESSSSTRGHRHWKGLDAVPEGKDRASWLKDAPGAVAEPQAAAEVAKIFLKRMNRFFIYEEYGAKYELMTKDVAAAHRTMPGWASYQKGLEILAASLSSAESRDGHSKKALTICDLLVKPIQRVCKYPLLFLELLKHTPVIDCPYSHMEVESTLARLREATTEINRATNDSRTKLALEKTWILQDRLAFPDRQLDAASRNRIRSFGHLRLCGALHVCWQTKDGASGQYMVALLYRDWLCLATVGRIDHVYTIQACIPLVNLRVEEADNGRGLQCHSVLHSWKIVFLSNYQLYELILTACSPKEELEWRARLSSSQAASSEDQDKEQPDIFSFLTLNIKSLGAVFRQPGTIARRISIHRASTISPKTPLYQVILRDTSATRENPTDSDSNTPINRSQSLLTTNSRVPVLAPARAERARLEALLSDVWTRDVLPFPGMTARSRSEHLVRASASSMMRKLSAVSITGSFSRRSASFASLHNQNQNQPQKEKSGTPAAAATAESAHCPAKRGKAKAPTGAGDPTNPPPAGRPRTETIITTTAPATSTSEPGPPGTLNGDADCDVDAEGLEMIRCRRRRAAATAAAAAATTTGTTTGTTIAATTAPQQQPRRALAPDEPGWRGEEEGKAEAEGKAERQGQAQAQAPGERPSLQRSYLGEMSASGLLGLGPSGKPQGGANGGSGGGSGGGGAGAGGRVLGREPPPVPPLVPLPLPVSEGCANGSGGGGGGGGGGGRVLGREPPPVPPLVPLPLPVSEGCANGSGGGGGGGGGRVLGREPPPVPPPGSLPLPVSEGSGKGKAASPRSRSLRFSGKKLAQAGVRRREAVAEGFRSLFRQGGC
ncbi:uncharacterized protein B0H64DRAFT_13552 [Chaetomium fimeti]|uniref:DH domain-containing protein n=1 Tax=Chaetomium fimeti TaxID=1854472 RepID=A0AAE0HQ45_9PEZI|nr:hypothetical protein B0H64DRAFT_13552 [Chaetomium fimeti]